MTTNRTTDKKGTGKYAKVNGLNLYYEVSAKPMEELWQN
jgi:hypothetical protein